MQLTSAWTRACTIAAVAAALWSCGEDASTPEDRLRAFVDAVQAAANESDIDALRGSVSASYTDSRGNDKAQIDRMIGLQILRGRPYVLLRVQDLALTDPSHAELRVLAGMARVPVGGFEELRKAAADVYVFDLTVADEGTGEWRVTSASWRFAGPDDLSF